MLIERLRVRNFKALKDVTLDRLEPFTVLVGRNGVGKSTLFDVFGFLRDCLKDNAKVAVQRRGGLRELVTRGAEKQEIELQFALRMSLGGAKRKVVYNLVIGQERGMPLVRSEVFKHTRGSRGRALDLLNFRNGTGYAVENEAELWTLDKTPERSREQNLDSPDILAIKGLGQFQRFEAASAFRSLIENWHVSDFRIDGARSSQDVGFADHLSPEGDNLALVTQYLYENHPDRFKAILNAMRLRVPGIEQVWAKEIAEGRIVLQFKDKQFSEPFTARFVSDGTIKMFAYLVLLYDPKPHPLLCVEEPENQLYPELLRELAEEFIGYGRKGGQVFVSSHSPDFLDGVPLKSIFMMTKKDGETSAMRAADNPNLVNLIDEGDLPGQLWRDRLLDAPV